MLKFKIPSEISMNGEYENITYPLNLFKSHVKMKQNFYIPRIPRTIPQSTNFIFQLRGEFYILKYTCIHPNYLRILDKS